MVWADMSSLAGHSDKQTSRMESGVIKFLLSSLSYQTALNHSIKRSASVRIILKLDLEKEVDN